jgi:hypothetical protein
LPNLVSAPRPQCGCVMTSSKPQHGQAWSRSSPSSVLSEQPRTTRWKCASLTRNNPKN